MKTITIIADDRIGLLSDITYILGKAKINIESIDVTAVGGKGVIHLTIKDAEKARQVLGNNGYTVMESNVLIVKLKDRPGELANITKTLSDAGIDIKNVHVISRDSLYTVLAVVVDKVNKARELLKDYLVEEEEDSLR